MTNETDRELLELAAKAAGIAGTATRCGDDDSDAWFIRKTNGKDWSPLETDGDALRLAFISPAIVGVLNGQASCDVLSEVDGRAYRASVNGTDAASMRRAIVMAYAKIGKSMP